MISLLGDDDDPGLFVLKVFTLYMYLQSSIILLLLPDHYKRLSAEIFKKDEHHYTAQCGPMGEMPRKNAR